MCSAVSQEAWRSLCIYEGGGEPRRYSFLGYPPILQYVGDGDAQRDTSHGEVVPGAPAPLRRGALRGKLLWRLFGFNLLFRMRFGSSVLCCFTGGVEVSLYIRSIRSPHSAINVRVVPSGQGQKATNLRQAWPQQSAEWEFRPIDHSPRTDERPPIRGCVRHGGAGGGNGVVACPAPVLKLCA